VDHRRGIGGLCRGCLDRELDQACAKPFARAACDDHGSIAGGNCGGGSYVRLSVGPNTRTGAGVSIGSCLCTYFRSALGARATCDCAGRRSNLGMHDERSKDIFRQSLRQQVHAARIEFGQHHESDAGGAPHPVI